VLRAIGALHGFANKPAYRDLTELASLLESSWGALQRAFSVEYYEGTKKDLLPVQEQNLRAVRAMQARIQGR